VHFPIGHRERREEGIPVLKQKFVDSVSPKLGSGQWEALNALCADRDKLAATAVDDFMALLVV
jgi:2-methylcitrate dehydratase